MLAFPAEALDFFYVNKIMFIDFVYPVARCEMLSTDSHNVARGDSSIPHCLDVGGLTA